MSLLSWKQWELEAKLILKISVFDLFEFVCYKSIIDIIAWTSCKLLYILRFEVSKYMPLLVMILAKVFTQIFINWKFENYKNRDRFFWKKNWKYFCGFGKNFFVSMEIKISDCYKIYLKKKQYDLQYFFNVYLYYRKKIGNEGNTGIKKINKRYHVCRFSWFV